MTKTLVAKFAGTCYRCRQAFPVGTDITWTKGVGAVHVDVTICAENVAAPKPPAVTLDLRPIVQLLLDAHARGLKHPKARFLAPHGGELRLSLSGASSRVPGSLQVCVDDSWRGRIEPDGTVYGSALIGDAALLDALVVIAGNPAEAAKAYGALMCRCSFCSLPLTDAGSVEVGYGPTCAKKWGLPHQPKGTPSVQAVA